MPFTETILHFKYIELSLTSKVFIIVIGNAQTYLQKQSFIF